ncbi:hypothetical protein [Actinocrispum sp. NPDC049592]|uniref:hypothetical protein n=1 Tax=Actinocrispum sp. NPDC049592 TaxID=3154835 RepID=UPI00342AA16B
MYPGNGQPQQNWQPTYQGLGYYQQPEPPRNRKNLVMIFSIVAIVVIVAAVVTIVLLNRGSGETPQTQPTTTSSSARSSASTSTSASAKTDPLRPRNSGWTVIKNDKARLIYEVPPAWRVVANGTLASEQLPDVKLSSPADIGSYKCENNSYSRGGLGAGTVAKTDAAKQAGDIAKAFGAQFYSSGTATVQVGEPKQVTHKDSDGKSMKGVQVDAIITTTGNTCLATKGKVSVLVFESGTDLQYFVVNGDLEGGPADPPPPTEADLQKIVDSARG